MIALLGASFDPLTNGHLYMIEKAAPLFQKLYIALAINPNKKYTFSDDKRLDMLERVIQTIPAGHRQGIEIIKIGNEFLVEPAKLRHVQVLLRGCRNETDYEYERAMRHVNAQLAPNIQTLLFLPPQELELVSSSFVKGMCGPNGWEKIVHKYVPPFVYWNLIDKFNGEWLCPECWKPLSKTEIAEAKKVGVCNRCNACYDAYCDFMRNR